jgi:dCMP deaminase
MIFSQKTHKYSQEAKKQNVPVDKPSWTEYFIAMASLASVRSCDSQTKHGCVITDENHRVLGIGYNSFPKGMPDNKLPNTRPYKYKWMVHAERNALANCSLRPENGIAYITGRPCIECVKSMYQEGISNLVCLDSHGTHLLDEEEEAIFEMLCSEGNIKVEWITDKKIKNLHKKIAQSFQNVV